MADVSSTLAAWSSTTASNAPAGSTTIGTGLDDNLREIQGVIVRGLSHKGADIASVAGTMDIGAVEGLMHDITGALAITGLGTVRAGIWKVLKFEGAATLTHNATSLILPRGANITCADGDLAIFISEGSGNWRCVSYMRAPGLGITLGTEQATTSGTSIDFTGIPAGVRRITVMFAGVSTNGTDAFLIQLGDSGGVENTSYVAGMLPGSSTGAGNTVDSTAGFVLNAGAAASAWHGKVILSLEDSTNFHWTSSGTIYETADADRIGISAGSKALSAELDRVRITTTGGANTFDAGAINISYEF